MKEAKKYSIDDIVKVVEMQMEDTFEERKLPYGGYLVDLVADDSVKGTDIHIVDKAAL